MDSYSAEELAVLAGVNIETVRRHLRRGLIDAKRIGRVYVISGPVARRYAAQDHKPGRPRKDKGKR